MQKFEKWQMQQTDPLGSSEGPFAGRNLEQPPAAKRKNPALQEPSTVPSMVVMISSPQRLVEAAQLAAELPRLALKV